MNFECLISVILLTIISFIHLLIYSFFMNEHHIKTLRIENFKSIKEMELECSRINVFVGKPNVGKSNILEAIGLLGVGFNRDESLIADTVRYEELKDLFHFENSNSPLRVYSNLDNIVMLLVGEQSLRMAVSSSNFSDDLNLETWNKYVQKQENDESNERVDRVFYIEEGGLHYSERLYLNYYDELPKHVKKYIFAPLENAKVISNGSFLHPSSGKNIISIIQNSRELRSKISSFVKDYGLEFIIDTRNNTLGVQRKFEDGLSYILPYSLTADTFQRMIFHHAAILSNKDSVILFEEPENHSYPPYIKGLAQAIVDDENNNQYFLTTHSPFIFNNLVENSKEVSVFIVTYENHETKIKKMTDDELSELLDYGVDIFYNLNWYVND